MPRRILVGYDHSEEAAAGLRRAAAMAKTERAELTVVHVAVPPPTWVGVGLLAVPVLEDVVSSGARLVREAIDELPPDVCVRWHLITGPEASGSYCRHRCVARALARALELGGHDLLVLGTGTRPGRVSRCLVRRCPDRVLTAPFSPQAKVARGAPAMRPSISLK